MGEYVNISGRSYDAAPDGRFLVMKRVQEERANLRLHVVENFFEQLRAIEGN